MSFYTGYTEFVKQKMDAEKVIQLVSKLDISVGDVVLHNSVQKVIKELWISGNYDNLRIRVEFEGDDDKSYPIENIKYGKAIKVLYG